MESKETNQNIVGYFTGDNNEEDIVLVNGKRVLAADDGDDFSEDSIRGLATALGAKVVTISEDDLGTSGQDARIWEAVIKKLAAALKPKPRAKR